MINDKIQRGRLFEQIADVLRNELPGDLKPGDRIPSDSEIAVRFNVSPVTIRQAVYMLVQEGLLVRRQGSGTFVAEPTNLSLSGNQKHIAILIDKDISHPQLSYSHRRVSEALLRFFEKRDIPVKRYTGRKEPWEYEGEPTCPDFLDAVKADDIKAVVAVATNSHESWAKSLRQRNVPIVGIWGSDTEVMPDYPHMIREAVDYLYAQKRRRIAILEWYDAKTTRRRGQEIFETFNKCMQWHDITVPKKWIQRNREAQTPGAGWNGFREIWTAFQEKPDGLIITDDNLFRDAASAILGLGIKVPQELSIITHANKGSGMFYPLPVAQMEIDPDEIANRVGEIALKKLAGQRIDDIETTVDFQWIETEAPSELLAA